MKRRGVFLMGLPFWGAYTALSWSWSGAIFEVYPQASGVLRAIPLFGFQVIFLVTAVSLGVLNIVRRK